MHSYRLAHAQESAAGVLQNFRLRAGQTVLIQRPHKEGETQGILGGLAQDRHC